MQTRQGLAKFWKQHNPCIFVWLPVKSKVAGLLPDSSELFYGYDTELGATRLLWLIGAVWAATRTHKIKNSCFDEVLVE